MAIAWYYDPEKNPNDAASLPGVPLRDLTEDEVAGYPEYIQRSIAASPLYRKTKPTSAAKKKPSKPAVEQPPADEPTAPSDTAPAPEQEG